MTGSDEIIFTGQYKDFKLGARFDLTGKSAKGVAGTLSLISSKIEPYAFKFSGINQKKIEDYAKSGKGLSSVISFFEGTPPGKIKEALVGACPKPELLPAAESYLCNKLLENAGVKFKVSTGEAKPNDEEVGNFIGFIGKYGPWIAIKKLGLEKAQDYEVSGLLSGVNHTIVNKAFDFAEMRNDSLVASVSGGKRRTYGNLAASLRELEPKLSGNESDAYAVCKVFEGVGYKPYASPEMLTEAYPDIKPPKVKGRKPKG